MFGNVDKDFEVILFHFDVLANNSKKEFIERSDSIKICLGGNEEMKFKFDAYLKLPTSLREINSVIENTSAKKKFNNNSSIKVKGYSLNKNEKKLTKSKQFIILTEKEIQLIELFLNNKNPISKDKILFSVWNYSTDADTHTVETHIYRLRKKITDKFMDEEFILNSKDGYHL